MGYWENVAAEIERVLGDELNPTDAYGRPITTRRMNAVAAPRNLSQQGVYGLADGLASASASPVAFRLPKGKRKRGGGSSSPDVPFPFIPAPGSEQWEENAETGRQIQRWWESLFDGIRPLPLNETERERERRCEEQAERDYAICRKLWRPDVRERCWASASARRGACITGKSLPPLITW